MLVLCKVRIILDKKMDFFKFFSKVDYFWGILLEDIWMFD